MRQVYGAACSTNIHTYSRDVKDNIVKELFLHLFILKVMPATEADSTRVRGNTPMETLKVSTVVQVATPATSVPVYIFTGKLQGILGFTITQVLVLVDNEYDSQESVL